MPTGDLNHIPLPFKADLLYSHDFHSILNLKLIFSLSLHHFDVTFSKILTTVAIWLPSPTNNYAVIRKAKHFIFDIKFPSP